MNKVTGYGFENSSSTQDIEGLFIRIKGNIMYRVTDYGCENSFFTQDIKGLIDINKEKIHMIRIDDNNYLDKNKADIFKDYMKNKPEDELYITTAYISDKEFPYDEYYIFEDEKDVNKKPLPVNEVLERENKIMEDAVFVNVNNYVDYEYKTAFIYPNEMGQKVIDIMNERVLECNKESEKEIGLD